MWPRRKSQAGQGASTVTAVPFEDAVDPWVEIEHLTEENRRRRQAEVERRLVRLRHREGIRLLDLAPSAPEFASPNHELLPGEPLADLRPQDLSPELLRAAILRDGCALVRGLMPRPEALELAGEIERAYQARAGTSPTPGYYEEFQPEERFGPVLWRSWITEGGGLLAVDSPAVCFALMEALDGADIPGLVAGYLGEPGLLSIHKTTLRKAEPSVSGAWHQDGAFMGPVRSLNLWLSLSRCGDEAPGLDLLPRRLDHFLATGTEGAELTWTISDQEARAAASGAEITRPVFEPGDALLFDELFLHKTGSDPSMRGPRFAVESWFFGGSAFPADYAPVAV